MVLGISNCGCGTPPFSSTLGYGGYHGEVQTLANIWVDAGVLANI
jgi:hypothetical protein